MSWEWKYLLTLLTILVVVNVVNVFRVHFGRLPLHTDWFHIPTGFAIMAAPAVFLLWVLGA